jgi:putative phosphoesterase
MKIAAIADTHVPTSRADLPDELLTRLHNVDRILHAGDLVTLRVLERLSAIAPTDAVAGNMDPPEVRAALPLRRLIRLAGRTIGLHHGHQRHTLQSRYIAHDYHSPAFELFYEAMTSQLPGAELIVFGHFHSPVVVEWRGVLFVNPGSIAPPHAWPTYAEIEIDRTIEARIVGLRPEAGAPFASPPVRVL